MAAWSACLLVEEIMMKSSEQCLAQFKLSDSPHVIPQYAEVPPNIEAKRSISYFYAFLF
jgi:hypothetical protein